VAQAQRFIQAWDSTLLAADEHGFHTRILSESVLKSVFICGLNLPGETLDHRNQFFDLDWLGDVRVVACGEGA
jgi:hypothetical protein